MKVKLSTMELGTLLICIEFCKKHQDQFHEPFISHMKELYDKLQDPWLGFD